MRKEIIVALVALFLQLQTSALVTQDVPYKLRVQSDLVFIDLAVVNAAGQPQNIMLESTDVVLKDDDISVPAESIHLNVQRTTRQVSYWIVVQCRVSQWDEQGSGVFRKYLDRLQASINHLETSEKVGVAHWCDDGSFAIDLPPSLERDKPIAELKSVLYINHRRPAASRDGEEALQQLIARLNDVGKQPAGGADVIPVVIFLHGDETGMPEREYKRVEASLLGTKELCFLINDGRFLMSEFSQEYLVRNVGHVLLQLSYATGGRALIVHSNRYDEALEEVFKQVKGRTELTFRPMHADGRMHTLSLELTDNAKKRLPTVELQYRRGYLAKVPASQADLKW